MFKKLVCTFLILSLVFAMVIPCYADTSDKKNPKEKQGQHLDMKKTKIYKMSNKPEKTVGDFDFPVAENLQAFMSTSYTGYSRMWSMPLSESDTYSSMYGVVNGYYSNVDSSVYVLEMQANIRGAEDDYINWLGQWDTRVSAVSRFEWSVWKSGGDYTIMEWAPSGSSVSTYGGYPINVTIAPSYDGVSLGSIGSTFTILQKNDTLNAFTNGTSYEVSWSTNNPLKYPLAQDLKATVAYVVPYSCDWSWYWSWNYNYWYY